MNPEVKIYFSRVYDYAVYLCVAGIYYVFTQPSQFNIMKISNQYKVRERLKLYKVGEL